MKRHLPLIGAIALAMLSFTAVFQKFALDKGARVDFEFPDEKVTGSIGGLNTEIIFDPENLAASSISGFVDVSTLDTGIKPRNNHLQSSGYFDAENHGQISFRSKSISAADDGYEMRGDLTMKGVSQEVLWTFTFKDKIFKANTSVYTLDYGVFGKKNREKSKVNITVIAPVK